MSTTSHTELIGHSASQQAGGTAVVDGGGPNIIIMENNLINCGDQNNKYIITSSSPSSQQPQQIILSSSSSGGGGGGSKKSGKISAQNRHQKSSLVVSNKPGHQMIMTNAPNIVTSTTPNHKEQRMYTVQQTKTPKAMYTTTQQVYTTNIITPNSGPGVGGQIQQMQQQQQQKVSTMPRNVQVVTKNSNNMILCRSPSSNSNNGSEQFIQQIHESNQPAYATTTTTTSMKTIYVNNNTGGLNLNKSSNNKILTPIDYSTVVEQQQQQQQGKQNTKYVTQKVVHSSNSTSSSGPELIDASSSSSSSSVTTMNSKNAGKNYSNNCTINVQPQTQYYYQPAQVYTTDQKVSSGTTTKIIGGGKNVQQQQQQQQPQYIQIQNHRVTSNNYVTTTNNPAPVQKHRTSTSNKYIIQNVQSNSIPVSSLVTQQQQQQQNIRQQPTVISYSNNSTTPNNDQPSVIQSPLKMRTVLHPIEAGIEDGARIYTVHHSGESHLVASSSSSQNAGDEVDASRYSSSSSLSNSTSGQGYVATSTTGNGNTTNENYMIVNGTKMTDEMSARILHDLSQRSSIKYNNSKSSNSNTGPSNGGNNNSELVQLSHHAANVYSATRQSDGTVIWNGTPQTMPQDQYIRRPSDSSNYLTSSSLPTEYQRQSSNNMSGDPHIIYQSAGIIVDRVNNSGGTQFVQQQHHHLQDHQDEEVIGIEVRPSPIPITPDGKLSVLHAVFQDHTYCAPMTPRLMTVTEQTFSTMNPNLESSTVAAAAVLSSMPGAAKLFNRQNSATGIVTSVPSMQQQQQQHQQLLVPQSQHQRDDDANSTISTGSHTGLYIDQGEDPGEETETALEGEGEEDSETRCICELTHDDGYMICCDSCSTWQHVDCMKIDRQNIPDEYQCVNCFPREVDVLAARTLQLQKRKEQSALQLYPVASIYEGVQNKLNSGKHDKKNNLTLKQKKKDLLGGKKTKKDLKDPKNSKRSDSANRSNGKRKDVKRLSKKKLKQLGESSTNTPDKLTSTLRNWIDNYEVAMTNHYSPELRARLQSLGKQLNPADGNIIPEPKLQWMNCDQPICTTVPHAGAKILISTRNIDPNAAIIEIRGKYMLDTQQNKSNNAMLNATRKPSSGPFLFYYSVPRGGPDICVDTRTYGNDARFIRRSCRPNAEIVHKIEKNSVHLYIVARYKIMEGAEITIAHDLNVDPLTRTNSMSHTSTLCACGLVRDCKFAAALAATPPLSSPPHSAPPLFTQNTIKRKNGSHNIGPDGVKEKRKYKKRKEKPPKEQKENRSRVRSTSSSAESHAGMLSPPLKNYEIHPDFLRTQPHLIAPPQMQILPHPNHITEQTIETVRSITPVIHPHETVYYESTGLLKQQLDAPHQEPSIEMHQMHQTTNILPKTSPMINEPMPAIVQPTLVKEIPIHIPEPEQRAITPIQLPPSQVQIVPPQPSTLHSPTPQMNNTTVVNPPNNVINKTEVIPKSPPVTPQKPQKRASKSQRNSVHEPVHTNDEASTSTVPNTPTKDDSGHLGDKETTSQEKRKLTREERKMEAIVKAFEKMEKTQQRKQEQKAHKTTPKKQRNLNSSSARNNLINANKRKMMNQKRKKRKSKSHSSTKKSDRHSGDSSDVATSSEENVIKQSSTVNSLPYQSSYNNSRAMSNADLLLSYSKLKAEGESNLSGIPPLISPACMLVEAAVGDLEPTSAESAFKFPHKTKTKKALMNEWLTQTDNNSFVKSESDSDIKLVAKKVEEFIVQNNIRCGGGDDEPLSLVKHEFDVKNIKNMTTPPQASSPQASESCSFAGSESAVKKRWLRQAISEETNDESGNSTQNEFTTPLKKRRVVIEQMEDASSPNSSNDVGGAISAPKTDDASQESVSESNNEEEIEETEVKKEEIVQKEESSESEDKSGLLTLDDVKVEEEDVKEEEISEEKVELKMKKEETTVEDVEEKVTNSIKMEEPKDEKSSNSDEMDHLHKVVASFHSESLMMLQTRNKKTSGTASLPETPKKSMEDQVSKQNSPSISEPDHLPSRHSPKLASPDTTTEEPSSTRSPNDTKHSSILAQTLTTPTTPVAETIPFGSSRYLNNIQRSEVPSILQTSAPVIEEYTPTADYRSSFTYRPMMTNLTMNEYPESSVHPHPDPYIPSYNKATLIAATTPTGATLTGQFAPAFSAGYPPVNVPPMPNDIASVSGTTPVAFLGKSYSTLNDTTPGPTYYGQKIFTKTASHDPRLNPSLVTTEEVKPAQPPQPKKKLSLTEYRKRKAQSTDSASNDGCTENNIATSNATTPDDTYNSKVDDDFPNKKKCTPKSSPTRNNDALEDTNRSENVTPTPCNNTDISTEKVTNSTSDSGNNSPTTKTTLVSDELPEKITIAAAMTSNENITGISPTQNDAHTSTNTKNNNNSAVVVAQSVDEDKK